MTGTALGPIDGIVSATGTVYLVDSAGLDPQYAAGLSVDFEDITGPVSGNVGDIYATAGLRLNDQARNLVVDIPSIPNATYANASSPGGMPFHITEVSLTVNGDTGGASSPLITNPHFCNDAGEPFDARPNFQNFVGSGTGYYGSNTLDTGEITVPYVVDNCASVPFNPSLDLSLTEPTAGSSTGINATVALPAENSTLRGVTVRLPSYIALNFPSFGVASDMCSGNDDGSGSANNVSPDGTTPGVLRVRRIELPASGADRYRDVDHAAARPAGHRLRLPDRQGSGAMAWHQRDPGHSGQPAGCQHRSRRLQLDAAGRPRLRVRMSVDRSIDVQQRTGRSGLVDRIGARRYRRTNLGRCREPDAEPEHPEHRGSELQHLPQQRYSGDRGLFNPWTGTRNRNGGRSADDLRLQRSEDQHHVARSSDYLARASTTCPTRRRPVR